jgi:hypothetical protein
MEIKNNTWSEGEQQKIGLISTSSIDLCFMHFYIITLMLHYSN